MDTVNTHEETVEDGQHTLDMLEKAEGLENPDASDRPEWKRKVQGGKAYSLQCPKTYHH